MKIGFFSDTHLGFDSKGERASESFENLEQSIGLCIEASADLIVIAGDVFDAPVPSHNILFRAMKSLAKARGAPCMVDFFMEKAGARSELKSAGVPIIAIHGNHEFLGKETRTALDVLNISGLIVYLHAGRVVAEKGGEKACIYGLGAVPEKKALAALHQWNPLPLEGASNILLLHQGFKEFMAVDDEMVATLSLDDLPKGFDLIVNGHLHWRNEQKLGQATFLLAGSTISTSIKKLESEQPKGVYFFDTITKALSFELFKTQRKAFYHKVVFNGADADGVVQECRRLVLADLQTGHELKPLIRLNLKGSLKKGLSQSDVDLSGLLTEFSPSAFLSVSKNFSDVSFKVKISELRELQKSRLSVAAMGFELLEKNLQETDFGKEVPAKELFDLLADEEVDKAMDLFSKY